MLLWKDDPTVGAKILKDIAFYNEILFAIGKPLIVYARDESGRIKMHKESDCGKSTRQIKKMY